MPLIRWSFVVRCLFLLLSAVISLNSYALPSYARQTGQECSACHVGGFGPQLTPYGIKFKIGGYTEWDGKSASIPLSAMIIAGRTQTNDALSVAPPSFSTNNNNSLQEVSLFLAGRFSENVGSFIQVTHSEPDRKTALDNFDLRLVKSTEWQGKDLTLGLSANNNPTMQDPFNTLSAWRFPYVASELALGPVTSPLIDGGLSQQVMGATAYGFLDDRWYAELGGYQALSKRTLDRVNVEAGDKVKGTAPYWRLAYFRDLRSQAYSFGLFGMNANLNPQDLAGNNRYRDIGIDASYQYLGTRQHVIGLNGSFVKERRTLNAFADSGAAAGRTGFVNRTDLSASYHYKKKYGATLGLFDIKGNSDALLYTADVNAVETPDVASRKNSPNTRGYILQGDWTPWGDDGAWGNPWAHVRFGLQYTGYNRFNGSASDYNGAGRNASANNTLFGFVWIAL